MKRILWALAAVALLCAERTASALDVGAKPPELDLSTWVQGDAVKLADGAGKTVSLVMFWGTFESDCVHAMTRMNELYRKHKDKGFDVVAVSAEPADVVRTFLASHSVDFRVAVDSKKKTIDAYGNDFHKLPWAWLVDKTGVVVWKGDPTWNLDGVVEEVISGKFDPNRAVERQNKHQELFEALQGSDWDRLVGAAQKLLAADPRDSLAFGLCMFGFERKDDHEGYRTFMKTFADRCKDDAAALTRVAERLGLGRSSGWFSDEAGYEWRDVDLALSAAKRAVEVSKSADADALETCGKVLYTVGLLDQAVEQQKKAIALDGKNDERKQVLAYYEACAATKKKAAQPAPPAAKKK